jgi:hypothetical protein
VTCRQRLESGDSDLEGFGECPSSADSVACLVPPAWPSVVAEQVVVGLVTVGAAAAAYAGDAAAAAVAAVAVAPCAAAVAVVAAAAACCETLVDSCLDPCLVVAPAALASASSSVEPVVVVGHLQSGVSVVQPRWLVVSSGTPLSCYSELGRRPPIITKVRDKGGPEDKIRRARTVPC